MNLEELREGVYDRLGVNSDDALMTAAVVNRLVNAALRQVSRLRDWPWLQTSRNLSTVDGTGSYAPADDWRKTRELRIDGDEPMKDYASKLELDSLWPSSTTRGRPVAYAIEGDAILLRPIPDNVYTVVDNYDRKEPDLANDSDEPLMPSEFHDAIVEKAASIAFRRTGETAKATLAEAAFDDILKQMPGAQARINGSRRIRLRPGALL